MAAVERERAGARRLPAARAERLRRRERFSSLSRERVRQVLPGEYPLTLGSEPWQPIDLRPGERVESYITPNTARIDRPGSEIDSLAQSFLPLAVKDERGLEQPVDLTLVAEGDAFVPREPLVDLRVPGRLADEISLPEFDLTLRPQTSNPDAAGSLVEGKLLFAREVERNGAGVWVFIPRRALRVLLCRKVNREGGANELPFERQCGPPSS